MVGSVALSRSLDPETWRLILEPYFQLLAESVYSYEGLVDQFTGDGLLALFGVPIAHEDHAERACRSAWSIREKIAGFAQEIRAEHGIDFAVRMGISSGEVVVGRLGERYGESSAPGFVVSLAARAESLAPAGSIYVTRSTAALAAGHVDFLDLGRFRVKGIPEPIQILELEDVDSGSGHSDLSRYRGPLSPFVGRDEELVRLDSAMGDALAGDGRVVGVMGDPGVGKSRLCLEFVERCRSEGLRVCTGHCVSHGSSLAFFPIFALLRDWFGIHDALEPGEARARVAAEMNGVDSRHQPFVPVLYDFLGIADPEDPAPSMDSEACRRVIGRLICEAMRLAADRGPLVLLIDDLHWIDGASAELLSEIAEEVAGIRVLLVLNYRPEYRGAWQAANHARQVDLRPLDTDASQLLLSELLGPSPELLQLSRSILERSGGNPFFIEEVVRSLTEQGVLVGERGNYRRAIARIDIPDSLHSVIAARIDRLDDHSRQLIRTAAVIGIRFSVSVLAMVSGLAEDDVKTLLEPAAQAGLVREDPGEAELSYSFHHPLTHEVAYRSQLERSRARLHARVATAIHDRNTERAQENAALLAYHWEQAGDTWSAARWHACAADSRNVDHALSSMQHWRRVRELVRELPESEETAQLGLNAHVRLLNLSWRIGVLEDEAESLYEEGKRLAERCGDMRSLAMLANHYVALVQSGLGRAPDRASQRSRERAREAAQLADASNDPGVQLAVCVNRLYGRYLSGDLRGALVLLEQTLEHSPEDRRLGIEMFRFSPLLWMRSFHGQLLSYMGRPRDAAVALDEALQWARENREMENVGWAEDFFVTQACVTGDSVAALAHAKSAVEIADTTGSAFSRILAYKAMGLACLVSAQWAEAVDALDKALQISREEKANVYEQPSVLALLAESHLRAGNSAGAGELARRALTAARERGARLYECEAELAHAGALLGLRRDETRPDAASALGRAAALIEQTGASSYTPLLHERHAELARLAGELSGWQERLEQAHRAYLSMGAIGHAERIARTLKGSAA